MFFFFFAFFPPQRYNSRMPASLESAALHSVDAGPVFWPLCSADAVKGARQAAR